MSQLYGGRDDTRRVYLNVWEKMQNNAQLDPMETIIAKIIQWHPEYHPILDQPEAIDQDFTPEAGQTNPYLHMGLHIAIEEQNATNQPAGFSHLYNSFLIKHQDEQTAQHEIMECLAEILWQAQQNQTMPDQKKYLDCLKKRLKKPR